MRSAWSVELRWIERVGDDERKHLTVAKRLLLLNVKVTASYINPGAVRCRNCLILTVLNVRCLYASYLSFGCLQPNQFSNLFTIVERSSGKLE